MKQRIKKDGKRLRIAFAIPSGIALFARIQKSVLDHVIRHGNCTVIRLPDLASPSIGWLRGWKGDGALVAITSEREAKFARKLPFPVVSLSHFVKSQGVSVVTVDNRAVGRLAGKHFLERRFTRFGFCGTKGMEFSAERRRGLEQAIEEAGYKLDVFENTESFFHNPAMPLLEKRLQAWLNKLRAPVGILAESDFLAAAIIEACQCSGLRVPEEIAVVGVDNDSVLCGLCEPGITSISRNDYEVGREAVRLLFHLIKGGSPQKVPLFIKPDRLVIRGSSMSYALTNARMATATQFVQENIAQSFGVETLISVSGMSRRRLEHHFRRELNCTPMEFIRKQRVERAKQLLGSERSRTLTSIARDCGFSSLLRFRLNFIQVAGMSPMEFRRTQCPAGTFVAQDGAGF